MFIVCLLVVYLNLFTSDLNKRLHLLSDEHDILTDAQFGVGKGVNY